MLDCDRVFRDCNCISSCSPPIPDPAPHLAHKAAEDVFRNPISPSVESLRRQQSKAVYAKQVSKARLPSGKISRSQTTAVSARRANAPFPISLTTSIAQEREVERLRKLVASDALQPLIPNSRQPNRQSIQRTPPVWYVAMKDSGEANSGSPNPQGTLAHRQPDFAEPSRLTGSRNVYTRPVVGFSGSPVRSKPIHPQGRRQTPPTSSPFKHREFPVIAIPEPSHSFHRRELVSSHERRFGVADPQL
ncbi:uncharacterized protein LY79DRAFT_29346 [Colletotrichum navitas]|uniref:Uncharacterized protein n=1 Tax=Colletotrichum navitas TaxID=681940 RepID=A0AAD8QEJ6_9PEZI|nr:uncharacterized protein LY79DRAFT_29346 [Colletotrichum navitas]KAK1600699.1 hypothetical protein LY79DRAFT_29346 [Colletotrichum navitas]